MDIRLPQEDAAAASRAGASASLSAVIRILEKLPTFPWRVCWVRVHTGLVLFYFHRQGDPVGALRRVPVGLYTLTGLPADKAVTLANAILKRAVSAELRSVRLPAEAQAVPSPLGWARYDEVAA